jgi:hypothetical protein
LLDEVIDPFSLYNYCSPEQGEHFFAGVAQLVEQLIRNQQVSGSSPLAGFKTKYLRARETGLFDLGADRVRNFGRNSPDVGYRKKRCLHGFNFVRPIAAHRNIEQHAVEAATERRGMRMVR